MIDHIVVWSGAIERATIVAQQTPLPPLQTAPRPRTLPSRGGASRINALVDAVPVGGTLVRAEMRLRCQMTGHQIARRLEDLVAQKRIRRIKPGYYERLT